MHMRSSVMDLKSKTCLFISISWISYPSVDCNYWLNREDTQLNEPTNQNSIKVPKVLS